MYTVEIPYAGEVDTRCDTNYSRDQSGRIRLEIRTGRSFQTPEAVLVYSENGLNGMSQTFQKLYSQESTGAIKQDQS